MANSNRVLGSVGTPSGTGTSGPGRWASWTRNKRIAIVGGAVIVLLVVIGGLAGPKRPADTVGAGATATPSFPLTSPTPTAGVTPTPTPTVVITATPSPVAAVTSAPTTAPTPPPTSPPTTPPTIPPTPEPTPSAEFVEFFDGIWEVGVEIPPGTYRTTDYTFACYWARLKDFSGELSGISANEFGNGYLVVTITNKDRGFESDDCGDWTSDLSAVTESLDAGFDEGTYIVGTDIEAGTWEADASDGCYWARLKGFKGTLSEIIANDFRDSGTSIVNIRASDAGFTTSGCGTWTQR